MRVLTDPLGGHVGEVADARLPELYAVPRLPWLRANMVSSLDGAVTGADGRSGSINNPADKKVFHLLRRTADAVVVGAGTARAEGYGSAVVPLVVVSRRGDVPTRLREAEPGRVLLATCADAPQLDEARALLGADHVLLLGEDDVDTGRLPSALHERGMRSLLCEGGPSLLGALLAAGVVDELCLTLVPTLVGGGPARILAGPSLGVPVDVGLLLEDGGTLLGRWLVRGRG